MRSSNFKGVFPHFRNIHPRDFPGSWEGFPDEPQGLPDRPEDRPIHPEGLPNDPEGSPIHPEDRPTRPEGLPNAPEGSPTGSESWDFGRRRLKMPQVWAQSVEGDKSFGTFGSPAPYTGPACMANLQVKSTKESRMKNRNHDLGFGGHKRQSATRPRGGKWREVRAAH